MTPLEPPFPVAEAPGTRFQRGLLFFTVIFGLLLLADLGLIGTLMFRGLSKQVVSEANARALRAARSIARSVETDVEPAERMRVVETRRAFTRHAAGELEQVTVVERAELFNAYGELVASWGKRADVSRLPEGDGPAFGPLETTPIGPLVPELPGEPSRPDGGPAAGPPGDAPPRRPWQELLPPDDPDAAREASVVAQLRRDLQRMGFSVPDLALADGAPPDLVRVSGSRRIRDVVAPVRLAGGQQGTVHVSLSQEEIDRQIEALRHDLLLKIGIGAVASIVLIVVAYLVVVKLFHKTRRLQADAQMADRLAYVGTLAAGLAHEIRNPLSAMQLNLQLLESNLAPGREPAGGQTEARELLGETQAEVERLGRLVTSFLSYARPPRLDRAPTDLNRVVEETVRFLSADATARGVRTDLDLSAGLPLVPLDATQVRQAILNIVSNAVSAVESNGGGAVRLSTGRAGPDEIRLDIEDDGPGIPPDALPRIFQVFYSGRPGGSGLGLPIARRVLEGHGGRIEVASDPGSGTRFTLIFPHSGARSGVKAAL